MGEASVLRPRGKGLLSSAYCIVLSVVVPISCYPSFLYELLAAPLCKFLTVKDTDLTVYRDYSNSKHFSVRVLGRDTLQPVTSLTYM